MKVRRPFIGALRLALELNAVFLNLRPAWFGHIRYATPVVHTDDHKHLASLAITHLVKTGQVLKTSVLVRHRREVEGGCATLDLDEGEMRRTPGTLRWEYSHTYDPLAGRGMGGERTVNALDEYVDFWERARVHARIGNPSKAYRFLGYCCHLLQDMAVPSHTYCVEHGLKNRTADNLELLSRFKRFYLREPAGPPYPGEPGYHVSLFKALALESRGREPFDEGEPNEIAAVVEKYYTRPEWTPDGWKGAYVGDFYYPYHRFLPSSPRIELPDLVEMRNYLMARAAERTAQLLGHFAELTGEEC